MADIPFTEFEFASSGGTAARTMPARLAEIKNVKDFGAVGDNVTNDRAAVQAAVNAVLDAGGGTVYFPPCTGTYRIGSPGIDLSRDEAISIRFVGEHGAGPVYGIWPSTPYYLFDRHLATPNNYPTKIIFERLQMRLQGAGYGIIRVGSSQNTTVRDCQFLCQDAVGITTEDAVGVSSTGLQIYNCKFEPCGIGVIGGGGGIIEGCDLRSAAPHGYILYGQGWCVNGCKVERTDTAYRLGVDSAGNDVGLEGFALIGHTFEGCWTCIDTVGTCRGICIMGVVHNSHPMDNSGPGAGGVQGGQYGYRFRANKVQAGLVMGVSSGGPHEFGAIVVEDSANRPFLYFMGNIPGNSDVGIGKPLWQFGTKAHNAGYLMNSNAFGAGSFQGATPIDYPLWTYAALPTGANVYEGDEYNITDARRASDNAALTTADWGVAVTGGGTTGLRRCRVRWNGTAWTLLGV